MNNLFEILTQYNFWTKETQPQVGFIRNTYLEKVRKTLNTKTVKVLIGQRRTGKSYIMRQVIADLIERYNVNPQNTFYLNRELFAFDAIKNAQDLEELFKTYIAKIKPKGKVYIFLDEVQNISNWEKFVVSYSQDYTHDYEIFITGSNSQLLSSELATLLSGRYIQIPVYPFSYGEFLNYKSLPPEKSSFNEYLTNGGLPELLNFADEEAKLNYIKSLKDTIILRDIIQRYSIKDASLLERIFDFLALNIGNLTSISSIFKYFKSTGEKVNFDTISDYTEFLCGAYVVHKVNRYNLKAKQVLKREYKFYLNDLSFRTFLLGSVYYNPAAYLENYIYLTLRRAGFDVRIGSLRDTEIDFVANNGRDVLYVQVAYLLNEQRTLERETGNLLEIKDNYPKLLVTMDDFNFGNIQGIKHIHAWDFEQYLKG